MVRGLVLLFGAALAQDHRPWGRFGERLGLRADTPIPKSLEEALVAVRALVTPEAPAANVVPQPRVGDSKDENGCALGGGYRWCEGKKKCLREWEEPCEAPATPVCTTGEVVCTSAMQSQGMNCVVGNCVKAPGSVSALGRADTIKLAGPGFPGPGAAKDLVGPGPGAAKDLVGPGPGGSPLSAEDSSILEGPGPKLVPDSVTAPGPTLSTFSAEAPAFRLGSGPGPKKDAEEETRPSGPAMGGARDANGCVTGGGYSWCEGKKKCLRKWEETCEEVAATSAVGGAQDEHGCAMGGGFRWCENKQKCLREWEEPCQEVPATPQEWIREAVSRLSSEQQAKVDELMLNLKNKKAQYKGTLQQKLSELKGKNMFAGKFGPLKDHVRNWAESMRKPSVVSEQPKLGAHERPTAEAGKIDTVVNGAI